MQHLGRRHCGRWQRGGARGAWKSHERANPRAFRGRRPHPEPPPTSPNSHASSPTITPGMTNQEGASADKTCSTISVPAGSATLPCVPPVVTSDYWKKPWPIVPGSWKLTSRMLPCLPRKAFLESRRRSLPRARQSSPERSAPPCLYRDRRRGV